MQKFRIKTCSIAGEMYYAVFKHFEQSNYTYHMYSICIIYLYNKRLITVNQLKRFYLIFVLINIFMFQLNLLL